MRTETPPRARWRRLLAEPFVHFALLAGAFFAFNSVLHPQAGRDIVVTDADVERLRLLAVKQYGSDPDPARLREIVRAFVREEVLYREAQSMGLDRDDVIVRRRLVQKFDYLAQADVLIPTEAELQTYYEAHRTAYVAPAHMSFEQVQVNAQEAPAMLARLKEGQPVAGKASMLARSQVDVSGQEVARDFGADFAAAVDQLAVGQWQGPVASALGLHLVRVSKRSPGQLQPLAAVHDQVKADLTNARLQQAREQAYAQARQRYRISLPGDVGP